MKTRPEIYYYSIVREYLQKQMKCVTSSWGSNGKEIKFERRGFGRLIADVYGLRGTDEVNSRRIEGIVVEVKRGTHKTSLGHLQQAAQYSRIAHRCFLAQPRQFDMATIEEASRVGVGLLEIRGHQVFQITDSQFFSPNEEVFLSFLQRSLKIFRCSLCGCYRFRYKNLDNTHNSKTGGHWRKDQIAELMPKTKGSKKVYFCAQCEEILYGRG